MSKVAVAGATGRVGQHVVEVLRERGHTVVPMSRSTGVDLITGTGLAEALNGVDSTIDVATGPSPDEQQATDFFTTATRNLQTLGSRAGVKKLVVVSIIGIDKFSAGYSKAKVAHEQAALAGPIPAQILRAAQFHEFVPQLLAWGTQGDIAYLSNTRTQIVAARTVAEALVDLAERAEISNTPIPEIAGPRAEWFIDLARLWIAKRGGASRVEVSNWPDPDAALYEAGALLPSPHAILGGPTFEDWLNSPVGALSA